MSGGYPTGTSRDCPRTPLHTIVLMYIQSTWPVHYVRRIPNWDIPGPSQDSPTYTSTHVYRVYMASTLCPEDTQLGRPGTVPGLPYIHTLMYIESEATWPVHYVRRIPNWDIPGLPYVHSCIYSLHGQYTMSGGYPTGTSWDCPRTPLHTYTLYTYTHVYRVRGYMASTLCPEDTQLGHPGTVPGLPYIHTLMYIESEATWPVHYVRRIPNWDVPGLPYVHSCIYSLHGQYTMSGGYPTGTSWDCPRTPLHTLVLMYIESTWPVHYVRRIPNWDVPGLSQD